MNRVSLKMVVAKIRAHATGVDHKVDFSDQFKSGFKVGVLQAARILESSIERDRNKRKSELVKALEYISLTPEEKVTVIEGEDIFEEPPSESFTIKVDGVSKLYRSVEEFKRDMNTRAANRNNFNIEEEVREYRARVNM